MAMFGDLLDTLFVGVCSVLQIWVHYVTLTDDVKQTIQTELFVDFVRFEIYQTLYLLEFVLCYIK